MRIIKSNDGKEILIDDKDFSLVFKVKWRIQYIRDIANCVRSSGRINKKYPVLSRYLMNPPKKYGHRPHRWKSPE